MIPEKRAEASHGRLGQEMAEDAMIWREYTKEADEHDAALLEEWNRNIDTMLILAALFSAVVTTFLIDSYKDLESGPSDVTNAILLDIANTLHSQAGQRRSPSLRDTLPQVSSTPSATAVAVNALYFTSLTTSLAAAAIAMLVKQWLNAYTSGLPASHRLRARMRQRRYDALVAWHVPTIISSLPLMLSVSIMIFLAGLLVVLFSLDTGIAIASTVIIGATFLFHIANLILPALSNCPWKTAFSPVMHRMMFPVRKIMRKRNPLHFNPRHWLESHPRIQNGLYWAYGLISDFSYRFYTISLLPIRVQLLPFTPLLHKWLRRFYAAFSSHLQRSNMLSGGTEKWWESPSENVAETRDLEKTSAISIDGRAILWLIQTSTKKALTDLGVQALAGLPPDFYDQDILTQYLQPLNDRLLSCLQDSKCSHPTEAELYARGLWRTQSNLGIVRHERRRGPLASDLIKSRLYTMSVTCEKSRAAIVTSMCACMMLNEVVEVLELHYTGYEPLSKLHQRLVVETLGQEISWRKRPDVTSLTSGPSGSLGGLEIRIVPLLIALLEATPWSPNSTLQPLHTSIALTIAIITQAIPSINLQSYAQEEHRIRDFRYLLCASFARILRFPQHFGCVELENYVRLRLITIGKTVIQEPRADSHYHSVMAEVFKVTFMSDEVLQEDIAVALAEMDKNAYILLDGKFFHSRSHLLDNEVLSPKARLALQKCFDHLKMEVGLEISSVVELTVSNKVDVQTRSDAFKFLIGRALKLQKRPEQLDGMVQSGFLHAAEVFFNDLGSMNEPELDDWMLILSTLCSYHVSSIENSKVMWSFVRWSCQDWRGRPLMNRHLDTLGELATKVSLNIDQVNNTSWFRVARSVTEGSAPLLANYLPCGMVALTEFTPYNLFDNLAGRRYQKTG